RYRQPWNRNPCTPPREPATTAQWRQTGSIARRLRAVGDSGSFQPHSTHPPDTGMDEPNASCSGFAQIQEAASNIRPAIIHADDDRTAFVGDAQLGAERQCSI